MLVSSLFVVLAINWRFKMFKTLKNQFAKMLIIFGGIFILIVFSGIFLGSYFSSQKEISEILKKSLITASKENIVPEKEDCIFLLMYVDNEGNFIKTGTNQVAYDPLDDNYSEDYGHERSEWFDKLSMKIAQCKSEEHVFKLNQRYYIFDSIEYLNLQKPTQNCLLFSIFDYTSYISNTNVMFFSLLIGYFIVIVLLSFSAIIIAERTISPIREAFYKQKELIANASHELKTPLTVINTNLSVLENNKTETIESQNRWINNIIEQTNRMNRLIYQMLDLSKTESLLASETKQPIQLSELIEKLVMEFEVNAFEKKIHVTSNIEENIVFNGNMENMIKLFTILIDNAIKYTQENGAIDLSLTQKKNKIEFTIQNTGKGIEKENLGKVFQRFYKQDESYNQDSNHSFGLGLAIAKAIVDQLNGTITVTSEVNVHTTFVVKLPK